MVDCLLVDWAGAYENILSDWATIWTPTRTKNHPGHSAADAALGCSFGKLDDDVLQGSFCSKAGFW